MENHLASQPTVEKQIPIRDFISRLRQLPESEFDCVAEMLSFLQKTPVRPETLTPYLTWNHQHYTRNLIDKTHMYELIAICWGIGHASSVHNHRDQNCWMTVPIGKLQVRNFRVVYENLNQGTCQLEEAGTLEMDATHPGAVDSQHPVHSVFNPTEFNRRAVSLHVYSRPFDRCISYSPGLGTCREIDLRYDTDHSKPSEQTRRC